MDTKSLYNIVSVINGVVNSTAPFNYAQAVTQYELTIKVLKSSNLTGWIKMIDLLGNVVFEFSNSLNKENIT